ncbi:hypothetical protein GCM10028811_07130 [Uliginosibacterium sediminicola]
MQLSGIRDVFGLQMLRILGRVHTHPADCVEVQSLPDKACDTVQGGPLHKERNAVWRALYFNPPGGY